MHRMLSIWSGLLFILVSGVCQAAPPEDHRPIETRVYQVADLVIAPTTSNWPSSPTDQQVPDAPKNLFEPLILHLKKITGADHWTKGQGEIEGFSKTLSLVIRQTSAIHDRIADELERLRREQDLQITLALTIMTGPRAEIAALAAAFPGELGRFEQQELRQKVVRSVNVKSWMTPKITTFNRQVGNFEFDSKVLLTQSVIAADRRSVQQKISYAPKNQLTELVSSCQTLTIHDGRAVAIRFEHPPTAGVIPPADDVEECLVLLLPRIIVQEVLNEPQAAAPGSGADLARKQFEALTKEYDDSCTAYRNAIRSAETSQERELAAKQGPNRGDFVRRCFQIADEQPNDPVAIDALIWIASEDMFWDGGDMALKILAQKHAGSPQVAAYASDHSRYGGPFAPYEQLLRAAHQQPHERNVHAAIGLTLAIYLKMIKENYDESLMCLACGQRGGPDSQERENLKRWTDIGVEKLSAEAEELFKTLIVDYGDVKLDNDPRSIVEIARQELYELRNLQIGNLAPTLEAKDVHDNPIKLEALRGKVVVLDFGSHSGCGICSALYPDLRKLVARFKDQPFALVGINRGDEPEKLRELSRQEEVTWSIICDGDDWAGPISSKWAVDGMPMFYVIDHKGIIRGKGFHGLFAIMPTLIDKLLAEKRAEVSARE